MLLIGLACGAVNGLIVIYGRLQPIVTTLATGAIFFGIALFIRPNPGSAPDFNQNIADALTGKLPGGIPASLVTLARRGPRGLDPVPPLVDRPRRLRGGLVGERRLHVRAPDPPRQVRRLHALRVAGFDGRAVRHVRQLLRPRLPPQTAGTYTLNSIASAVLGGVSLFGGSGSAVGAIFGAFILRTIGDLLFVFDLDPLWQPLFQGVVLLAAVCLGSVRLFQIRNRLDLYG